MELILKFWDEDKKEYVEVSEDNPFPIMLNVEGIEPIADPSSATAEEVAHAFNNLLAALKG